MLKTIKVLVAVLTILFFSSCSMSGASKPLSNNTAKSQIKESNGSSITTIDVTGRTLNDAKKALKDIGFVKIKAKSDDGKIIIVDSNWTVVSQNIEVGIEADKNTEFLLTCHKNSDTTYSSDTSSAAESTSQPDETTMIAESKGLSYSTNDYETAKNGNSGVFAYQKRGKEMANYYIIDFDEGYVYWFCYGNGDSSCDRIKIVSGDLNEGLEVTWHDVDGSTWTEWLHFKYKRQPDTLIMIDKNGFDYKYTSTNLDEALKIKSERTIIDD